MTPELEKELRHKAEELDQIKEILAIFLEKVYFDVDDITPDDLELKLRELEKEKDIDTIKRMVDVEPHIGVKLPSLWLNEIQELCKDLGWTEFNGYSPAHNIKLFIKSLARENFQLKRSMEGAKQNNGDTRTDNLCSSDATTS